MDIEDKIRQELDADLSRPANIKRGYASLLPGGAAPTIEEIHKTPIQQAANAGIAALLNTQMIAYPVDKVSRNAIGRIIPTNFLSKPDYDPAITSPSANSKTQEETEAFNGLIAILDVNTEIDPNDAQLEQIFRTLFPDPQQGVNSAQVEALINLRTKLISPAEESGITVPVRPGWVAMARAKQG